jgi:hypothetical protein
MIRALEPGTYMGDIDIGDFFLFHPGSKVYLLGWSGFDKIH